MFRGILLILLLVAPLASGQLIIAHRGASFDAPENTLAAFRLAWERGADGIEGDFRLTKDGKIVCLHDDTTKRTAVGKKDLKVAGSTFEELRRLDVGSWKDPKFEDERIPTLGEVLETVPEGRRIFIEVKCGPEIVPPLKTELEANPRVKPEQVVIIAFNEEVVRACRREMPGLKINWLTSFKRNNRVGPWTPSPDNVMATLRRLSATGLGCKAEPAVMKPAFVTRLKEAGFEFHCWTINDAGLARRFRDLGVESITTDRPVVIREALGATEAPVVREGWDWSLPDGVEATDYSGYFTWGGRRFHPSVTVRGVMVTWKRLNPEPGKYDWDWLRGEIAKNKAAGMRTGIHLKGVQRDAVPDWVVEKHDAVVIDVPVLQENQPWRIQTVPPWQPSVDDAFHAFLREFGKTGIAQDDDVVYAYIHGISASRGEEMFIRPVDWEMWQKTTGVTAEIFADWLRRRIDAMCDLFKGAEHKLAVMWQGPFGVTPELRTETAGLHTHAFERGCGIRGGGIDFMHVLTESPAWGSRVSGDGYLLVDDEHPTIKGRRIRADENEEYGKYWEWRFGPVEGYPYRHRICVLRGLQMRQNFQLVSQATMELNPELIEYARITQGYRRDDSPDAWAYLRQFDRNGRALKNIERWLIQRDAEGSRSMPCERVDRFPLPSEKRKKPTEVFDLDARRTDVEHGQDGLLFGLDRAFWNKPQAATIKVTFTDRATAEWYLSYADAFGKVRKTAPIRNTGDGKRKTATFRISELAASGSFPNDPTFLAWRDRPVAKVGNRVVNQDFRNGGAHWQKPSEYEIVADAERAGGKMVEFTYQAGNDDTVHMDQVVDLEKGEAYQLTASIRTDGTMLKPGVRVGGMDWLTIAYVSSAKPGEWETISEIFEAPANGKVRLQLFGQGRGYAPAGQVGKARFREISIVPVPRKELVADLKMDLRLVTDGPGDLTVTMVRVVKGQR